jgi:hypothetical protein
VNLAERISEITFSERRIAIRHPGYKFCRNSQFCRLAASAQFPDGSSVLVALT